MPPKSPDDFVEKLTEGSISSVFAISNKTIKLTRHNKEYLDLVLSDKTGTINGRMFSNGKLHEDYQSLNNGDICSIEGNVEVFKGMMTVKISHIQKCEEKEYIITDFKKSSDNDSKEMMGEILETIDQITRTELKSLLELFFNDEKFVKTFCEAPAAKRMHHNYAGGLLEHTLHVLKICKTVCSSYPKLDCDLLFTGAILHDIGKMKTYDYHGPTIEFSDDGLLLEHIYISAQMVKEKSAKILISEETVKKVIHLILSHHGEIRNGWGSAVNPFLAEATALHYADNLDAKIKIALDKNRTL